MNVQVKVKQYCNAAMLISTWMFSQNHKIDLYTLLASLEELLSHVAAQECFLHPSLCV